MAVDDIRLPSDHRKGRKGCLGEEGELFQIIIPVAVGLFPPEVAFIIDEIKCDPFIYILEDPHITALAQIIHIEMVYIGHFIAEHFFYTEIFGYHHTYVKVFFVKTFGKRTHNVRQAPGLDKRHSLRSDK